MGRQLLKESFRNRLGMSEDVAEDTVFGLFGEESDDELAEDDVIDDAEDDDEDDTLDIVEAYKKIKKLRGKEKIAAKKYRRSAAGKKAAKRSAKSQKRMRKTSAFKIRQKKLAKMGAKKGYRRMVSSDELADVNTNESLRESLMENLHVLAEGLDADPSDRFEEFVEAFNHIADIGEVLTIHYHNMGEDELAEEAIELAIKAEQVINFMEDLDGVVDINDDEVLEAALAEAMEETGFAINQFNELTEDEDDDNDWLDEAKKKAGKKGKGKKGKKGGKLTAFEKSLTKGRKDIRDPKALAGWLAHYEPHDRTGE